ncbi:hypothetical protein [Halorussus lipolyticus]|uniref:hypothetical protein n=1 Tax=Halorussus lipolyticus TaxID=3034024 RepID=UPI0023E79CFE|nr:hypothetical protein [Halorussus sp. DT80]
MPETRTSDDEPTEQDDQRSDEQRAQELLDRPHPKRRETDALQDELSAVWDLITNEQVTFDTLDRLRARSQRIFSVIENRLGIEYPECENCGSWSWGQEPGEPLHCEGCDQIPDEEVREEVHDKWRRVSGDTEGEA